MLTKESNYWFCLPGGCIGAPSLVVSKEQRLGCLDVKHCVHIVLCEPAVHGSAFAFIHLITSCEEWG